MEGKRSDTGKHREQSKDQQLQALRDRLYSRTGQSKVSERHAFSGAESVRAAALVRVAEDTRGLDERVARPHILNQPSSQRGTILTETPAVARAPMPTSPPPNTGVLSGYRAKLLALALIFFALALVLSSSFLFFGQHTISGDNIAIDVRAPFALGGGETLSLQVAVANRNAVAVEAATLIIEYPPGTQEADISGKELFRQRVPLGGIKPGEVLSTTAEAKLFGEENEEKTINVSVEYRVQGSNATFFKEAEPVVLKVSTSPVALSIAGNTEVSSGQEITLTLTLASNASSPLADLLVQAEYPSGFDFSESSPKTVKGQNLWSIASLAPEASEQIMLRGTMTGGSAEERTFAFSVGVSNARDRFALSSVLATAATGVTLTDPFVGLTVLTDGSAERIISLGQNDSATVSITFENTLSDTIYDGAIRAVLAGNGLNTSNVTVSQGFFDSSSGTVTWDKSTIPGLAELGPGARENVSFTIRGANLSAERTPQVSYSVSVSGRRVSETRVPQELTNIESHIIRFESAVSLSSHGLHSIGPFANSGPMPPRAETTTQYTVVLEAKNGSNELADAVVSASLPPYVSWSGAVSSGDDIAYNAGTREATWRIGTLPAGDSATAAFQVSFLPSVSQVGTVPVLVGEQHLRATDRFTGTIVRATAEALTTHLPGDPNPDAQVGRVLPKE